MITIKVIDIEDGSMVEYNAESVDRITTGKASQLYSLDDIIGNGMNPHDILTIIFFRDGNRATFGSNYIMDFNHAA